MSFLSYRTRIPRHFDSHANVRSTTQRRGLCPFERVARLLLFADPSDVRDVPGVGCRLRGRRGCRNALSRHRCCWLLFSRLGPLDHDRLDRRLQEFLLHDVGPGDHHAQRAAVAVGQQALLGPFLAAVGGVLARLFPPRTGPCPASRRPIATPTAPRRVRRTRRPGPPRSARRSPPWPTAGTSRGRCSWGRIARAVGPTGSRCASGR